MEDLVENLKKRNLSDSSIKLYLRNLVKLNDDVPPKNLNFLMKTDDILQKLEKYKGRFRYPFLKKLEKHKGRYGTGTLFKKN